MEENLNNIKQIEQAYDVVFISDVHLQDKQDAVYPHLEALFAQLYLHPPKVFVLLGDIFDFCFGPHPYFKNKFDWFYQDLIKLQKLGTIIYFVEGNHEFAIEGLKWKNINFINLKNEPHLFALPNFNITIAHGDLFAAPWKYIAFRSFVKSNTLHFFCELMSGSWLDRYAKFHSSYSRDRSEHRKLNHKKILDSALEHLKKTNNPNNHLVFGHFHYPYAQKVNGNQRMISMHSWYKPNALVFCSKNGFQRLYIS